MHCTLGELDCESFAEEWQELQVAQQGALQCKFNMFGVAAKVAADLCLNCCLQLALELHQVRPGLMSGVCLCGLGTALPLTSAGPQGLGAAPLLACHCWDIMLAALHARNRGPTDLPMQAIHAARALSAAGLFAASGLLTDCGCLLKVRFTNAGSKGGQQSRISALLVECHLLLLAGTRDNETPLSPAKDARTGRSTLPEKQSLTAGSQEELSQPE